MDERQQLEKAIAELEAQRGILSDEVIDAAVVTLHEKLASLDVPGQQRKLVTILYTDIVGSTEIVKHLDPEDALEIMDGALKYLALPVGEHDGHVTRFMGDGFKAVFGVPVAHENDPEMAIRAGLGILQAAQQQAQLLQQDHGITGFQVRVGINTGLVATGGFTEAEDTIMGSPVNLAARLESAAPPGSLLISHHTYRHVRGVFNVAPQDPIAVKGFDDPVQVYQVLSIKPRAYRVLTRGVKGLETRTVGRQAELLMLQNALKGMVEGQQTEIITVVGETGVGKSRLLYEFHNWIDLLPHEVIFFQGCGRQETHNLPYALLKDVFSFRFQIQENDRGDEVNQKVEAGFGEIFGCDDQGEMRAQIIGQLLGYDFSNSLTVKAILDDPQQIRDRSLMYLAEYFRTLSEAAPTVILLEDIHWADDSSLDVLNRLARRIPKQRLLIICAARHSLFERRPHWGEGLAYHRRLELQPLSKHDSNKLVMEILQKVEQIPPSLQELVVNGSEGNPFYIEELIKMLIEDGVIIPAQEHWQVEPQRLTEIEIPPTLTGVLQARLEALPPGERITLQQASVVGQIFWDDTIVYLNTQSKPTDPHYPLSTTEENLASLRTRELIYHREDSTFSGAVEFTFKHAVLQDVTYESILRRVRRDYHGLVAEWLIRHIEERAGEYTGLIADHLELAGKIEQAAIYLYQAGEAAANRYANKEAVAYYSRALALTSEDDLIGQYDLLMAREKVLDLQSAREEQLADLKKLVEIANAIGDINKQAEAALKQIMFFVETDNIPAMEAQTPNALELINMSGNVEYQAGLYLYWGRSFWKQANPAASLQKLQKALEITQKHQLHQLEVEVLRNLGIVYIFNGEYDRAISLTEQAYHRCRQLGDRRGESQALNNLGIIYGESHGDFNKTEGFYQQAHNLFSEIGNRAGEALTLVNLGYTYAHIYNFDTARECFSNSLVIFSEIEAHYNIGIIFIGLSYCDSCQGNYEGAKDYIKQALEVAQKIGSRSLEGVVYESLMEVYWILGDYLQAEIYYQMSAKLTKAERPLFDEIYISIIMTMLKLHMGDHKAAGEFSHRTLDLLAGRSTHELRMNALIANGHVLLVEGDHQGSIKAFQEAVSLGLDSQRLRGAMESRAGWAQTALLQGDLVTARYQVGEILAYLDSKHPQVGHPLDGTLEPYRIYRTCYQVLSAGNDPRAARILTEAYNLLQTRSANISDKHLRSSFLNNVAVNREIIETYEANL